MINTKEKIKMSINSAKSGILDTFKKSPNMSTKNQSTKEVTKEFPDVSKSEPYKSPIHNCPIHHREIGTNTDELPKNSSITSQKFPTKGILKKNSPVNLKTEPSTSTEKVYKKYVVVVHNCVVI